MNTCFLQLIVRDYECDSQGIVNNAVYNNYFEHARNTLIFKEGYTLSTLFQNEQIPVVTHAVIHYKYPLRSGNVCCVTTSCQRKGSYRILFSQSIIKIYDTPFENNVTIDEIKDNIDGKKVCAEAVFTIAIIGNQKPLLVKNTIFEKMFESSD